MVDTLKKVQPGDPLVIPAGAYNTFVDAARDYLDRRNDQAQTARPAARNSGIVLVRNDLNPPQPAERFWVLGIGGPVVSPSDNLEEFSNRVVLSGAVPWISTYRGRFVVLLEPLAAGAICRAQSGTGESVASITTISLSSVSFEILAQASHPAS